MSYRNWTIWTPGLRDAGQADESTRERAEFHLFASGLDPDEKCRRAFRATEVDRVAAETRRAAVALAEDEWSPMSGHAFDAIYQKILNSRLTTTMAALNLMGIQTLLPGEAPFEVTTDLPAGTRIYLREPSGCADSADITDGLHALSGLIGDFQRTTIYLSGLRIRPEPLGDANALALVALHRTIMGSFGDFLARKYIVEGWSLV